MNSLLKKLALLWGVSLVVLGCSGLNDVTRYSVSGGFLPSDCEQVIVGMASDWDSSYAHLVFLEKDSDGRWLQKGGIWPARLGSAGLVWGLGVSPVPKGGKVKVEGDKRTPAGIFDLDSRVFAYDVSTPVGNGFSVKKVTPYDLWVEDAKSPLYNQHLVLDHLPATEWEKSQQMKQDDPAHKIKLFIHHNSTADRDRGRPLAGKGSSIFFHIWRDNGKRATAGCTAMSEKNILEMLTLLDAKKKPMYIILPRDVYKQYYKEWHLPPVSIK